VNTFDNGLLGIGRKALMIDDVLMKVVSQEITAASASVSVINSKEGGLDSIFIDVKNDADTVFVIIPGDALMSVDGI